MRNIERGLAALIAIILMFVQTTTVLAAVSENELDALITKSAEYILSTVKSPEVGSTDGEWAVIGLARSGYTVSQSYWDNYYAAVESYVKSCGGVLHEKKYTEYSRVIAALTAIGADPSDVAGYNLLTPLGDFEKTIWQGLNGPIWALIALDSGNYDMPINASAVKQASRQMYIDEILSKQLSNGGWSLTGKGGANTAADPDITGMALQALSKYMSDSKVNAAVDDALKCLSAMQTKDGGYTYGGADNCESVVQVIVGLCELGISLDDNRFIKDGNSLLDKLLSFSQADGSFTHTSGGDGNNLMSSEQGLYTLTAVSRAVKGKGGLYKMDDVTISVSGKTNNNGIGLPGKHDDIKKVSVSAPGTTFDDISGHANKTAIESLAAREIITGIGGGLFKPDESMTRAQFATIAVKALGLTPKSGNVFSDVASAAWYAQYIGTAHTYELIDGRGDGIFDPEGTITRQEAAVLIMRAAAKCGMDTEMSDTQIRDTLAQFEDYMTADSWALQGLAFCYSTNILDQSDLNINAKEPIMRCEIAQMIFNLLTTAKLI